MSSKTIRADIKTLYELGTLDKVARIHPKETLIIIDCCSSGYDCKSIIVELNRGVILSHKTTKELVEDFRKTNLLLNFSINSIYCVNPQYNNLPLSIIKINAKLIPIGGYARKFTNWIMLSQVKDYWIDGEDYLHLKFKKTDVEYLIKIDTTLFERIRKSAEYVYKRLMIDSKDIVKTFTKKEIGRVGQDVEIKKLEENILMKGIVKKILQVILKNLGYENLSQAEVDYYLKMTLKSLK